MIVIHHNPACGTSNTVLRLIRASGVEPIVVDYLTTGWTRAHLLSLLATAGLTPRDVLRTHKTGAEALGLTDPSVSDDTLLDAMLSDPVLVNRPLVCTPKGIALCRPALRVLDLLPTPPVGEVLGSDGERIWPLD